MAQFSRDGHRLHEWAHVNGDILDCVRKSWEKRRWKLGDILRPARQGVVKQSHETLEAQ